MITPGEVELAVVVAEAGVVALDSPTAVGVASVDGSVDGDDVVTDEDAAFPASLLGEKPDAAADDAAMVDDSTEVTEARGSTVKELPIDTSTATPGADRLVSPAVLANTTAA